MLEDKNEGMTKCITVAHISDNACHLYAKITWLTDQYDHGVIKLAYMKMGLMLVANHNTKPANGEILHQQISFIFGIHFYPNPSTQHYKDLEPERYTFIKYVIRLPK